MAKAVMGTVRVYVLNGTFIEQDLGENISFQNAFTERIGDLPNRILSIKGVYEVRVMNDRIEIFYLQLVIRDNILDINIEMCLDSSIREGKLTRKTRALPLIKRVTAGRQQLTSKDGKKRLRRQLTQAIAHFVSLADDRCTVPTTSADYRTAARTCISELSAVL